MGQASSGGIWGGKLSIRDFFISRVTKMMVWSSFVIFLQARVLRLVMLCSHLSVM